MQERPPYTAYRALLAAEMANASGVAPEFVTVSKLTPMPSETRHGCTHRRARELARAHTHAHMHTHARILMYTHTHKKRMRTRSLSWTVCLFTEQEKTCARVHAHRHGRSSVLVSGVITGSTADLQGKSAADAVTWYLCVRVHM